MLSERNIFFEESFLNAKADGIENVAATELLHCVVSLRKLLKKRSKKVEEEGKSWEQ
jgi:hypothetical protein